MSDSEGLDDVRERKREQLKERLGEDAATDGADAVDDGGTAAPDEPVHVEDGAVLRDLLADHDLALADFYADWCGPCQMLDPVVEAVAADTAAAVLKVDVDAHEDLASEYGVRGVPTLVLFADGEVAEQVVGVREKADLVSLVERHGSG